ncbi:MAG TPA: cytochrome c, partial [Flavitalea sp.]|nr:cytochrome c [Flavitalea sp.]
MIDKRPGVISLVSFLIILLLLSGTQSFSQDGAVIFQQNCASCHAVNKDLTGPKLAGVEERGPWSDRKKVYDWVHNPARFMQSDPYTQGLKASHGNVMMTAFPQLSDKEIDAILAYVKKAGTAAPATGAAGAVADPSQAKYDDDDNSILYGILTLILAVVALVMLQVNSNLKKLADDK